MERKEILEKLSVFGEDQPLPREALAEAVRQRETITPVLLDALDTVYEKVQTEGDGVCDDPTYGLSAYAIFLLAQFHEQRAFPKLLRLLTLDRDSLDIVLDDILSYMGNILYSTYDGNLSAAKAVIADSSLDPFAREAPLNLLEGLFRDGRLPREEMIDFLRERLALLGEGENEEIIGAIIARLIADNDLYELVEDVREAFRLGKVDLMHMGDFDSFFDYLYNETEHGEYTRLITDTVQELDGWACFKAEGPHKPSPFEILDWKAGRNDPCPCGSGKKFKKCCLPKQEELRIKFSPNSDWKPNWDRFPPVERRGERPGLSDFYNEDAIAVDRLAYQGLLMVRRPNARQRRETKQTQAKALALLWEAFENFQQVCEAKGLKTAEEYDREHKLHYYCKEWLEVLRDLLKDREDDRYLAVQAVVL